MRTPAVTENIRPVGVIDASEGRFRRSATETLIGPTLRRHFVTRPQPHRA
jgi:hypothetical protein